MPGSHSNYAPSSAHRWLACPGCVSLSATLPAGESSVYAREGTAAHSLGEAVLAGDVLKDTYSGVKATDEMHKAVSVYVRYVREAANGRTLELEQRVSTSFEGVKVFGTADAAIVEDWGTLEIVDYKHGSGKVVEVKDNPQLILYAVMAAEKYLDRELTGVKVTIVQPRAPHKDGPVRSCEYSMDDLAEWRIKFADAIQLCETQMDLFIPGQHCQWCRAGDNHVCPALKEQTQALAKAEFTDIGSLSVTDVKRILDCEKAIIKYIKTLKERVAEEGLEVDGYKAVQGYGHRNWTDKEIAAKKLRGRKFKAADIYEKKLLSPAKLMEKFPVAREYIEAMSERKPTRMLLVPDEGKSAKEEF